MKLSENIFLRHSCTAILALFWAGQTEADETVAKKQDGTQSHALTQDERAINEILRLGGQYWNSPRGPNLPKKSPTMRPPMSGTRGQQAVVSNTPLETAQPPLVRAYLPAAATDESLRFFSGLSHLEYLSFDLARITDAGLSQLTDLPKLRNISLERTLIGDAGLSNLKVLPQFEIMSLQGTKITDEGLKLLSKQTNLQRLFLDNTGVTDIGLKYLEDLAWHLPLYSMYAIPDRPIVGDNTMSLEVSDPESSAQCKSVESTSLHPICMHIFCASLN